MDFLLDKEKMQDFYILSKEEFLNSYSYLKDEDYERTIDKLNNIIDLILLFR